MIFGGVPLPRLSPYATCLCGKPLRQRGSSATFADCIFVSRFAVTFLYVCAGASRRFWRRAACTCNRRAELHPKSMRRLFLHFCHHGLECLQAVGTQPARGFLLCRAPKRVRCSQYSRTFAREAYSLAWAAAFLCGRNPTSLTHPLEVPASR